MSRIEGRKPSSSYSVTIKSTFIFKKWVLYYFDIKWYFKSFFSSKLKKTIVIYRQNCHSLTTALLLRPPSHMHLHETHNTLKTTFCSWVGMNYFLEEERADWEQLSMVLFFSVWFFFSKLVWRTVVGSYEGMILFGEGLRIALAKLFTPADI